MFKRAGGARPTPPPPKSARPVLWLLAGVAVIAAAVVWIARQSSPPHQGDDVPATGPAPAAAAAFVGQAACEECHAAETSRWRDSMHARAMMAPTRQSVEAPFGGERFSLHGVTTTFSRKGDRFIVRTDGPDGAMHDYDVAYTFGVDPLQQFLLPLPGGRLQALSVSWDSRPKSAGGQRWFHLYPHSSIPAGDVQHWTSPSQNWNARCAECHSTNLRKNYDAASGTYKTTWSDVSVACESCHGAGSRHVAWARARAARGAAKPRAAGEDDGLVPLGSRDGAAWTFDPSTGIAHRDRPRTSHVEVEMCARCHARRAALTDDYHVGAPLADTHRPALLDDGLYFADGQIQDEVYEYGSFLQSRMYANGVTCTDCHDPHRPEIATAPDDVCLRCHQPAKFATPEHHHHREGSAGGQCVACHMASRLYMTVDRRRDHSFRVPRPDLTVKIGTPNACSGCHADRTPAWAAAKAAEWFGTARTSQPHYGEAIAAGRALAADAESRLLAVVTDATAPAIVRATAVSLLGPWLDPQSVPAVQQAAEDPDPLVRLAAVDFLGALPEGVRPQALARLLADPVRAVRIDAARSLAAVADSALSADDRAHRDRAIAEWTAVQQFNGDSAAAHVNLGGYHLETGDLARAQAEFETATRLEPYFAPAAVSLANVYRAESREADEERVLREAVKRTPEVAMLHHALGLALVRRHDLNGALVELKRASELEPSSPDEQYTYAVALYSAGKKAEAVALLERASRAHPGDRRVEAALNAYRREP